jgi:OOP family OmpA-OmpF porin
MTLMLTFVGLAHLAACTVTTHTGGPPQTGGQEPPPAATPAPAPTPAPTAEPAPAPKKSNAVVKGDSVQIPGNIVFDSGKASLKEGAGSEVVLDQLKLFLDENPQVTKLRVEGHTDNVGKPADNEKLSGERALTIKKWLVDKGVAKERLIAAGFGEKKPIADNTKEDGRAQNRRTEFRIAELKGKPYLGMDPTGGGKVFDM